MEKRTLFITLEVFISCQNIIGFLKIVSFEYIYIYIYIYIVNIIFNCILALYAATDDVELANDKFII